MKFGFLVLIILSGLLLGSNLAQAGDEPCQSDLLKPKIKAASIKTETKQSGELTINDVKSRLAKKQRTETEEPGNTQPTTQSNDSNNDQTESASKTSKLGGIFDLLLPSALRNPVK